MDKLGLCALNGIDAVFRHTLYMGNYAMTDDDTTPNPVNIQTRFHHQSQLFQDYWLSLLYRTLIGDQVLAVESNVPEERAQSNYVRFYAHKNQTQSVTTISKN